MEVEFEFEFVSEFFLFYLRFPVKKYYNFGSVFFDILSSSELACVW